MNLPTLEEFLGNEMDRSYIADPNFNSLYLRKGSRYIHEQFADKAKLHRDVLQIGNIAAATPGKGAFKRLLEKMENLWGGPIYVENVMSSQFACGLLKLGFLPVDSQNNTNPWDACFAKHLEKIDPQKI